MLRSEFYKGGLSVNSVNMAVLPVWSHQLDPISSVQCVQKSCDSGIEIRGTEAAML